MNDFVRTTQEDVRDIPKESELLRSIHGNLTALLSSEIPEGAFMPRKDKYAMNLIFTPRDRSFSVIAGVWRPGQTTPIHDHLTWALVGVYRGREKESIFRRIDDNRNEKMAKLEVVSEKVNGPGYITVLGERGIHRVDNPFEEAAWTIHIYGKDIGNVERHSYDPVSGEISTFTSGYCNVLRDTDDF